MRINPHHVFVLIHARTQTTTRPTPTTTTIFSPPHPTFGLWGTRVKFPEPTWLRGPIKTSKLIGSHLPPLVHEFWYPPPRSPRHVSSPASPFLFTLNKLLKYSLHNFFFFKKKIFFFSLSELPVVVVWEKKKRTLLYWSYEKLTYLIENRRAKILIFLSFFQFSDFEYRFFLETKAFLVFFTSQVSFIALS